MQREKNTLQITLTFFFWLLVTLDERRCSPAVGEGVDQGDDGKTDEGKLAEDKRWKYLYNNGGDDDYLEED